MRSFLKSAKTCTIFFFFGEVNGVQVEVPVILELLERHTTILSYLRYEIMIMHTFYVSRQKYSTL